MNEFKLTGNIYVSKSGNDLNPGNDPDNPKLTIASGLAALSNAQTLVIGTGVYEESNLDAADVNIIGDGIVVLRGNGANTCFINISSNINGRMENLYFTDYVNIINESNQFNQYLQLDNCVINGGIIRLNKSGGVSTNLRELGGTGSIFINVTFQITNHLTVGGASAGFNRCIFINTSLVPDILLPNLQLSSCFFNTNCIIDNIDSIIFSNIRNTLGGNINTLINNIDEDPLFLGDPLKLEFVVQQNSPMIATGQNGVNIGNVKIGNLQNNVSIEWGINPSVTGNTSFGVSDELILTSGTSSDRDSDIIDLGQIRNSPFMRLNGLVDFLNNVPDTNNSLLNPNHITFAAQWAGNDGIFNGTWKLFRWNERLQLDITNKSNGESDFDWGNVVDIELRFLRVRTTIRDDYNVA